MIPSRIHYQHLYQLRKEIYHNLIGAYERANWEVHFECPSSTGDPHEQFGRCPGASLLHFFPSENRNDYLWILNAQEQFLNVQEQTLRLKNTSWIFKAKVEIQGPFLEFPRVAQNKHKELGVLGFRSIFSL